MSKANTEAASAHTKKQLLASEKYASRRDVLSALLEDGKSYTTAQVDALIEKYMKGKVR